VECSHRGMPHPLMDVIEWAQAPYLAFLDADDFWSPLKLERHVHFFQQHPEVDLTFSWSRFVDEHGRDTGLTSRMCRGAISFSELLADNVIGNGSTLVVRREAFLEAGGIDPSMPTCYDVEFCLRMALLRPGNLCAIPELLTSYRRRPGQLTGNIPLMEQGFEHMIEKMRALEPSQVGSKHRQSRSNMRRFFAFRSFQEGRYAESLRRLGRSFREAPAEFLTDKRNWQMIAAAASGLLLPSSWHGYLLRATLRTTRA